MTYQQALLDTIVEWNKFPISDEWLFADFREIFVNTMSTIEAFESINWTVDILLSQNDESTAIEVLETLISLARQSETTEIPSNLYINKDKLLLLVSEFGEYANNKLRELFSYYRWYLRAEKYF